MSVSVDSQGMRYGGQVRGNRTFRNSELSIMRNAPRLMGGLRAVYVLPVAIVLALINTTLASANPGRLDSSFGHQGELVLPTTAPECLNGACHRLDWSFADAQAPQPDGQLLLGGWESRRRPGIDGTALVRIDHSGALDTSFGAAGRAAPSPDVRIAALDALSDGTVVAVVASEAGRIGIERYTSVGVPVERGGTVIRWLTAEGTRGIATIVDPEGRIDVFTKGLDGAATLSRYLASGEQDRSFGSGGDVALGALRGSESVAVATTPSGELLVGGITTKIILERIRTRGTIDRRFGRHGVVALPAPRRRAPGLPAPLALAISTSRILVATGESVGLGITTHAWLVAYDLTPVGEPRPRFGTGGAVRAAFAGKPPPTFVEPKAIAFDTQGNAVVVGTARTPNRDGPNGEWFLARYTRNGRDCSFGSGGLVLGGSTGGAESVSVDATGHILIAGWIEPARGSPSLMVARYRGGGSPRRCP
jgi:uncharacterized delta-60 repeat protein